MNAFPSVFGERVIVNVPSGLPELMKLVTMEVLRTNPVDEMAANRTIAGYLEWLLEKFNQKDDLLLEAVINMDLPKLTMSAGDRYIEKLKTSGYTAKQLNTFAIVIQKSWRHFCRLKFEYDLSEMASNYVSDLDERVNVVKRGDRDYVPPVPDIDILSDKIAVTTINEEEVSYEDNDNVTAVSRGLP